MTQQTKLALVGVAAAAIAKLYLGKDNLTAVFYGASAMSAVALFTARNVPEGQ